ncbi:MAG: sigma-70 family RNA polymerase sigma factor [Syntrophomonadaceae bacterium]|nr:sigma-70 family RNA polymerase sigma factor [Syntrophomonadaceae bacterium]
MIPVNDLIKEAKQGSLKSFEELVLLYQDRVYTHCVHLANNNYDAQDLAQDVFVQAFKNIRSFREEADFGTWLHRIAINLWINWCRKQKRAVMVSLDEPLMYGDNELSRELAASQESALEILERTELHEQVRQALNRLPPEYKAVLVLREMEGYSYEDIAGFLNCSLGTVKSRINRARKALLKEIKAGQNGGSQ